MKNTSSTAVFPFFWGLFFVDFASRDSFLLFHRFHRFLQRLAIFIHIYHPFHHHFLVFLLGLLWPRWPCEAIVEHENNDGTFTVRFDKDGYECPGTVRDPKYITGWWFGCHFWHFPRNIGFLSSSQLTKSSFSEGLKAPTRSPLSLIVVVPLRYLGYVGL